jgi:hypothetical protein
MEERVTALDLTEWVLSIPETAKCAPEEKRKKEREQKQRLLFYSSIVCERAT